MNPKRIHAETRPFYAIYEERRQYPRIVIDVPVQIQTQNEKSILADAYDISPDGLQIRCERLTARALHPSGRSLSDGNGPQVDVTLYLPFPSGQLPLSARCKLFYVAVCPRGDIAFGLQFVKFEGSGSRTLSQFIEKSIEPARNTDRSRKPLTCN